MHWCQRNSLRTYHFPFFITCVIFFLGTPERSHSILLQFSINGGITWHLMDEFYFPQTTNILFINVPLPYMAQTNATRFRLWQPYNNGKNTRVLLWSKLTGMLTCLFLRYEGSVCQLRDLAVHSTHFTLHTPLLKSPNEFST